MALSYCAIFSGIDVVSSMGVPLLCSVGFDCSLCALAKLGSAKVHRSFQLDRFQSVRTASTCFVRRSQGPLRYWLFQVSTGKSVVYSVVRINAHNYDKRWVPPWWSITHMNGFYPCVRSYQIWLVVSGKSLLLWLLSKVLDSFMISGFSSGNYAIAKFLIFLQGLPSHLISVSSFASLSLFTFLQGIQCQLLLNKPSTVMDYWPFVSNKQCSVRSILVLIWFSNDGLDLFAPPPPPAPNIRLMVYLGIHSKFTCAIRKADMGWNMMTETEANKGLQWHKTFMSPTELLRPVLIWFEFSGLQPPWQVNFDLVCSNCLLRYLLQVVFVSYRDPLKQSDDTAARKHCGAVYDGTIAQICVFLVCCLRWEASMICFLPTRYGLPNIDGHGWEFNSINGKTLVLWETSLYACFICKLSSKGLYLEFVSCYVLHFMQLPCKHLNFE